MPEDASPIPVTAPEQSTSPAPIPFNIGEEYGTAKKNLPPAKVLGIVLAVATVVVAIIVFVQRPRSAATGSIDNIVAVDVPQQNTVMVAINASIHNHGNKVFWIKNIQAALDTKDGHFTDDAASAVDFDRYFQALPVLKQGALAPLIPEIKMGEGASLSGTVIVSFPVTSDQFAQRKSLSVTIQPYDGVALVISK